MSCGDLTLSGPIGSMAAYGDGVCCLTRREVFSHTMRFKGFLHLGLLAAVMLTGCDWAKRAGASETRKTLSLTKPKTSSNNELPKRQKIPLKLKKSGRLPNGLKVAGRTFVILHIRYIEVPIGQVSESEELWSYLDEEPIGARRLACLGRNGIRAGVGRSGSLEDVLGLLKRMTGRQFIKSTRFGLPLQPHQVELKVAQSRQSIFLLREDGTLSGQTYMPGDNVLTVACGVDQDDNAKMIVTGIPQIRGRDRKIRLVTDQGFPTLRRRIVLQGFPDLRFQLPVAEGEFVIIGPGAASRRRNSIGRQFFVCSKEGMDYEIILVLQCTARRENAKVARVK